MAIAMLAEAFAVKDLSSARIKILDKHLSKVPASLLAPMTERVIATRRPRWGDLPTVSELLEDAEVCRRELLAQMAFVPCASCEPHGWIEVEIKGVKRQARCGCWTRHQGRLQELGAPLAKALPSGQVDEGEPPALDDVAPGVTDRVRQLAAGKRMP